MVGVLFWPVNMQSDINHMPVNQSIVPLTIYNIHQSGCCTFANRTRSDPMRMRNQMNQCGMGGQMWSCVVINQSNCNIWSHDVTSSPFNQSDCLFHSYSTVHEQNRKCTAITAVWGSNAHYSLLI